MGLIPHGGQRGRAWKWTSLLALALVGTGQLLWSGQAQAVGATEGPAVNWEKSHPYRYGDFYANVQRGTDGEIFFSRQAADKRTYEIVRVEQSGTLTVAQTVTDEELGRLSHFIQTKDGGFLLAGLTRSNDPEGNLRLLKLNGDGEIVWANTYPKYVGLDIRLLQTDDGGYVLAAVLEQQDRSTELYLAKLEQDGKPKWETTFEGAAYDAVTAVRQTVDGGIVMLGAVGQEDDSYRLNRDLFLVKVDKSGKTVWERRHETGLDTVPRAFAETPDGSLVIAGTDRTISDYRAGYGLGYLLKVDKDGKTVWEKRFAERTQTSALNDIQVTGDGDLLVSGCVKYEEFNMNDASSDGYAARLGEDGVTVWEKVLPNSTEQREQHLLLPISDEAFLTIGTGKKYEGGDYVFYVTQL
ncbi:outer membrane protein assembly factor BamB family protein [Brevibacillus thermoruber]|uniref:outer membrane protein assembly factor BamB family protein n=1 Tax=Brevibacillus thermoruber TaxID=33942 RepID=UPI004041CBE1